MPSPIQNSPTPAPLQLEQETTRCCPNSPPILKLARAAVNITAPLITLGLTVASLGGAITIRNTTYNSTRANLLADVAIGTLLVNSVILGMATAMICNAKLENLALNTTGNNQDNMAGDTYLDSDSEHASLQNFEIESRIYEV